MVVRSASLPSMLVADGSLYIQPDNATGNATVFVQWNSHDRGSRNHAITISAAFPATASGTVHGGRSVLDHSSRNTASVCRHARRGQLTRLERTA
jgi:hypothetical protein